MKRLGALCLCLVLLWGCCTGVLAADTHPAERLTEAVGDYLYQTASHAQPGVVGGEWLILGLARSDLEIAESYYESYYRALEEKVRSCNGVLHSKKYTEYSRTVLALSAIGKDPRSVAGYNLLLPLADYEKTVWQGVNGSIWALIALDSRDYEIPQNPDATVNATRELYVRHILERQTSDGGWALSGDVADPDLTGMALQALSRYRENTEVQTAIDKALQCMSDAQDADGGFCGWKEKNAESCAQMLVALCTLGISVEDPRFVKNQKSVLDCLLTYYEEGKGFCHTHTDGKTNLMATEQAFYALVAYARAQSGKSPLYQMNDVAFQSYGLPGKNENVTRPEVITPGKTFADIQNHPEQTAVETLASCGIINGRAEERFEPEATMTRAEFATIVVKGLGLPLGGMAVFEDVSADAWYFDTINTAYSYGIIQGITASTFCPEQTISREEALVMVARAAALCGMDWAENSSSAQEWLTDFSDVGALSDWAVTATAFCYANGIVWECTTEIHPQAAVTRAEIAIVVYRLLGAAELL